MISYCPRITGLSNFIWHYLTEVFSYSLPVAEIGLTNHLVFDMVNYYANKGSLCEAFAIHAPKESLRGADIDLFIENESGLFIHYMLQAKVMNYSGRFLDISKWSPSAQFVKLKNTAYTENATPLYLLYSGKSNKSTLGNSSHGASVIGAEAICNYRYGQKLSKSKRVEKLHFDILYPLGLEPYQVLFCGESDKIKKAKGKSFSEIYTGYPYLRITRKEEL